MKIFILKIQWALSLLLLFVACTEEAQISKLKLNTKVEKIRLTHPLPQVDLLFVLDTKNLAPSYQQNLADHIDQFMRPLEEENKILNFNITVVDSSCGNGPLNSPIKRTTARSLQVIQQALQWETSCDAPHRPFQTVVDQANLYRSQAALAVIFVTDTMGDEEDLSLDEFKKALLNLKGQNMEKIALYGAIVKKNDPLDCLTNQQSLDDLPVEIEMAITHLGGLSFNLCTSLLSQELEKIGEDISYRFGELFIPLQQIPASSTITVQYRGQTLQKIYQQGWTYDPNRKGISIGTNVNLPPDLSGVLEISFYPSNTNR